VPRFNWHRVFHPLCGADLMTLLRLIAQHGLPSTAGSLWLNLLGGAVPPIAMAVTMTSIASCTTPSLPSARALRRAELSDRSAGERRWIEEAPDDISRDAGDVVVVAVVREGPAPSDRAGREHGAARGRFKEREVGAHVRML
jgi:hypothetical protein